MKKKPYKDIHYKKEVWVNPTTEPLRKENCLCLQDCSALKPGSPDNCRFAQALFEICVKEDIALMMTICHHRGKNWINPKAEARRVKECLCLNCGRRKVGHPDNCETNKKTERIRTKSGNCFIITRCPLWEPIKK